MQLKVQIFAILISLTLLVIIVRLVYQRRLRVEYSLLWLLAAIALLVLSILGGALARVAGFLGIEYPPSLLFAVAQLFAVLILLSQTVAISSLARKNRDLVQKIAILEWHIERLREDLGERKGGDKQTTKKFHRLEEAMGRLMDPEATP